MGFDFVRQEDFGDAVEVNQGVVAVVHSDWYGSEEVMVIR